MVISGHCPGGSSVRPAPSRGYLVVVREEGSDSEGDATAAEQLDVALHSPGYLRLLVVSGLVGIPISAIAFGFLAAVHELEHVVWDRIPHSMGFDDAPAWWPIPTLGLAGLLCAVAVTRLRGPSCSSDSGTGRGSASGRSPSPTWSPPSW